VLPDTGIAFWEDMDELLARLEIVIDRPRGSAHPRYPNLIYPYDYGYLRGTRAMDQDGVDVWVGTNPARKISGVICAVDLQKMDVELKLLAGCMEQEMQAILRFHNDGMQSAILISRPGDST
jgi:inorganic pyrophosphatase